MENNVVEKCEVCGQPARGNFQKLWVKYPMIEDGRYLPPKLLYDWGTSDDCNRFFCLEHGVQFENGTID